jgi:hypothetical protein
MADAMARVLRMPDDRLPLPGVMPAGPAAEQPMAAGPSGQPAQVFGTYRPDLGFYRSRSFFVYPFAQWLLRGCSRTDPAIRVLSRTAYPARPVILAWSERASKASRQNIRSTSR